MSSERGMNVVNHSGGCTEVRVTPNLDKNLSIKHENVFTSESRKMQIDVGPGGGLRKGSQQFFDARDYRSHQGPILSTATDKGGMVRSTITENSLVTAAGVRMTVRQACELGYLQRDGAGGFKEVSQESGPFVGNQASQDSQAVEGTSLIGNETDDAISWLSQNLGTDALGSRFYQLGSYFMDGNEDGCRTIIKNLADSAGVPVEVVAEKFTQVFEGFNQAAYKYLESRGVYDPEALMNFGEELLGEDMKKVYFMFFQGDAQGFDALIKEWNLHSATKSMMRFKA